MKKWSKLVLATMVSMGTLMISGCIENLEPAGIADLRGAKAELLRAQTALQAAQAAKVEADAALVLAQAKVQEAIAKQEEARVKYFEAEALAEQYRAELLNTQNEEARANLELLIAQNEAKMAQAQNEAALAAKEFEVEMLRVTTQLAVAQTEYDKALELIELSKNVLSDDQVAYLQERIATVSNLKSVVGDLTEELEVATMEFTATAAELDTPKASKVAAMRLERAVVVAEAKFAAAQEAEAEAKALLELDPMVTDWAAQLESLDGQLKALKKERDAKAVAAADRAKVREDSLDLLDRSVDKYSLLTGYEFNYTTGLFSKVPGYGYSGIELPEVYVAAPRDADGNALFGGDFKITDYNYAYGSEASVLKQFEDKLLALSAYTADVYQEEIDYLNEIIESARNDVNFKIDMTKYEDAVAAYQSGDYLAYFNKYEYAPYHISIEDLVADYNEALAKFETAIAEYEKVTAEYDVDISDAYTEITRVYDAETAAADKVRYEAYQKAQDDLDAAELVYEKAVTVYVNAQADFTRKMAIYTKDASESQMKDYVDAYDAYCEAGGDPENDNDPSYVPATYALYKKNLASIEAAKKAFNDPDPENDKDAQSVYDKATDAYADAQNAYHKAIMSAGETFNSAYEAADLKRDNANRELMASVPTLDLDYLYFLDNNVRTARSETGVAMNALVNQVEYNLRDYDYGEDAVYRVAEGTSYEFSQNIWGVPEYLREEIYDPVTNTVSYKLVKTDVKSLQDAEYFLAAIESAAENLIYVYNDYQIYAFETTSWTTNYVWRNMTYVGDFDGYPLALPDFETYLADYSENFLAQEMLVLDQGWNELAQWGYDIRGWYDKSPGGSGVLANIYAYQMEIAEIEAEMANLTLVPDFAKAIEAAKAEVEKYMEEKAAEIEALKADVEANYPRLLAEIKAIEAEVDAFNAKNSTLEHTYTTVRNLISQYCDGYIDVDDFSAELEAAYESAVQATFDAEEDLIEAQKDLEDFKNGLVTAVQIAQRKLDEVTEALAVAQTLLDTAVENLDAALKALCEGDSTTPAA